MRALVVLLPDFKQSIKAYRQSSGMLGVFRFGSSPSIVLIDCHADLR